jgi:hypothetical protein
MRLSVTHPGGFRAFLRGAVLTGLESGSLGSVLIAAPAISNSPAGSRTTSWPISPSPSSSGIITGGTSTAAGAVSGPGPARPPLDCQTDAAIDACARNDSVRFAANGPRPRSASKPRPCFLLASGWRTPTVSLRWIEIGHSGVLFQTSPSRLVRHLACEGML